MAIITQEDREHVVDLLKANKQAPLGRIAALAGVGIGHVRSIARMLVKEGVIQERKAGATGVSGNLMRLHADPEFTAAASERMKRLHADPDFAARSAAAASENLKRLHTDPKFAARRDATASERMKQLHADPEFAARSAAAASERMKKWHALRRAYGHYWIRGQPRPPF